MAKPTFRLLVVSLKGILFDDQVESVYLRGDEGEFELLAFHYPLLASLPESDIQIAHHDPIPIRVGVVMFNQNTCTVVIEEGSHTVVEYKPWESY